MYDGTELNYFAPAYMYMFDRYSRSQYIIPAADLATINGKVITALKFYSNTSNKTSTCNVDVYLKEVSYTTFDEETPTFETKSGIVYTGKLSIASDGTLTITFTTPYTYNGGNLLIGMENTGKGDWVESHFYGQEVAGATAYGSSSTGLAEVTANWYGFIPKTTFTYEPPVPGTAVDLGLPNGKKWADRNVGTLSATGYGTHYAWSSSDIATAQWGSNWRMPTLTEAQELINNTDQVWATIDGWASVSYAGTTLKVLPNDDARGSNLPSYTTLGSTTVSNWAVATRTDYTAIFTNLGSTRSDSDGITYDEHVNAYITSAGGTEISGENWSITQYDSTIAWRFSYSNYWGGRDKTNQYKVRPVLGF